MLDHMARHWWTLTLRGALAVLFACIAFLYPFTVPVALVILFGAYSLVDGIFALIAASRLSHQDENWQPLLIEGVIGVLFGIITFADPTAMAIALIYVLAAWAVLTGILEIVAAVRLRQAVAGEWFLIVTGILSLLFGALLLGNPGAGLATIAYLLGGYALLFGIFLIALSLRLRRLTELPSGHP